MQNLGWCRRRWRKRPYLDTLALAALVFPTFFSKAFFTDADRRGSAASFRIFSAICVASERLRECVGMSPPRFISIAEPHYGVKTGRGLVKLAQTAGMGDAEDRLCFKQNQQRYEALTRLIFGMTASDVPSFPNLNIEHGVRRVPLRKEKLLLRGGQRGFAVAGLDEGLPGTKLRHACLSCKLRRKPF